MTMITDDTMQRGNLSIHGIYTKEQIADLCTKPMAESEF